MNANIFLNEPKKIIEFRPSEVPLQSKEAVVLSEARPDRHSPGCGRQTCWPCRRCECANPLDLSPLRYAADSLPLLDTIRCASRPQKENIKH